MYKRRKLLWPPVGIFILFIGLLIFWPIKSDNRGTRLDAKDAKLVAQGQRIYAMHCASCHGTRLEGQANWRSKGSNGRFLAPPHDDSGHTWHHSDARLVEIVKNSFNSTPGYQSNMPAFNKVLIDEEIIAVLSFIKSHWSVEHQAKQEKLNLLTL
jgi:mono/diheme cytochrome c family protein